MKSTKKVNWNSISKSFKQYLKEAEEVPPAAEEEGGEAAEVDPNAAAATTPATPPVPAGIPIKFNIDKVKRYNTGKFLSDAGTIKSIDKKGIVVTTQPDGVDVLVNFDDISESVKRFFKTKK